MDQSVGKPADGLFRDDARAAKPAAHFRYDINALRALGVVAVVLFHYRVNFVPGGFVGVDVFFVISGYLMTSIIMRRLDKGRFSLWDFYRDRAKRIIPGLIGVCFVLLVVGYLALEPTTYHQLSSSAISSLLFYSNYSFWRSIDYFDTDNNTKWLLHTWSLSVEWQFYLLYPLMLMALYAFQRTRRFIVPILASLALLSLFRCIWLSYAHDMAAFYLLPPRAWELIAGGIIALRFDKGAGRYSLLFIALGFLFIGISLVFFGDRMLWPSYAALLPVGGTCLIIAARRTDAPFFKGAIVQTLGKWSYSIYLWHWPVAVAAVYFGYNKTTILKVVSELLILALVITFGAGVLALAKALRERSHGAKRVPQFAAGVSTFAFTLLVASIVTIANGLPQRRPDSERALDLYRAAALDWDYPKACNGVDAQGNLRPCQIGPRNGHGILFIGDSFAEQYFGRYEEVAKKNPEMSFTFLASGGCPAITGIRYMRDEVHCNGFVDKVLNYIDQNNFRTIVIVSNWINYLFPANPTMCFVVDDGCRLNQEPSWYYKHLDAAFDAFGERLRDVRKRGIAIVILASTPSSDWDIPVELAKRKFLGLDTQAVASIDRDRFDANVAPLNARVRALAASIGAKFVDPLPFLCDRHRCPTIDEAGVPYFVDRRHYRLTAIRSHLFQFMDDALGLNKDAPT